MKHADETGWRDGTGLVWLWAAITPLVTVFMVKAHRSTVAAQALLGKAKGVPISDRYSAYHWWPVRDRQICWAHLIRDFTAIAERGGASKRIGDALLEESKQLSLWWNRVRDGTLSRDSFRKVRQPIAETSRLVDRRRQLGRAPQDISDAHAHPTPRLLPLVLRGPRSS